MNSGYGFGWINYARGEEDVSSILKEISGYKFKEESRVFKEGPKVTACLDHKSWKERCVNLLKTFFSRDGEFSGIITFPDTSISVQGKQWQSVMSTLKNWCNNLRHCEDDATGLIIRNYNLINHLKFCKIIDNEKEDYLSLLFKNFERKFKLNKNNQRFLVFNPSEKVILVIRMVDIQQSEELKDETYLCIDEIKIVSFLLRDELKHSGVMVAGLVTYSWENAHSHCGCKICDNFIVSCKILNSVETFDEFWKNLSKGFAEFQMTGEKRSLAEVFQAVGSKILGYLAHLQFKMEMPEEPVLPVTQNNVKDNIIEAELLLDRYQMEIAYSDDKRILLDGDYGTGKTVVALKKAELLHERLKENEVIYYVTFPEKSRLDCWIKQKLKKYEKIRVLRGCSSLLYIVKNEILLSEEKNGTKSIHLIVDEYDLQHLSPGEWENLYQIFTETEHFKNSTVMIALQAIKIDRVDHFHVEGKKKRYLQENMRDKLENSMKMKNLKYVMRSTVQINTLVKFTQNHLSDKSNLYIYTHDSRNVSRSDSLDPRLPGNSSPKSNPPSDIASGNSSNPVTGNVFFEFTEHGKSCEFGSKKNNPQFSYRNASPKCNSSVSSVLYGSSNPGEGIASNELQEMTDPDQLMPGEINPQFSSQKLTAELSSLSPGPIDHDKAYKLARTSRKRSNKHLQKTISKYSYASNSEIGHSINGPLPQLIELKSRHPNEQIPLIAYLLMRVIKPKRIAIIHFEPGQAKWLCGIFKLTDFQGFMMTNDVGKFLANPDTEMVLVSCYDSVKGLEFNEVLLILEKNEYYERHYIPEAIARCMSKLYILIRPSWEKNEQSNAVKKLLCHWQEINDAKISRQEEPILKILTLGFCSKGNCKILCKNSNEFKPCIKTEKISTFYGVHKNTKTYINLSSEIENKIVPNLQMHDTKEEEKSFAL